MTIVSDESGIVGMTGREGMGGVIYIYISVYSVIICVSSHHCCLGLNFLKDLLLL